MDHTNEGVLKLLQDIKEILLGIALLLLGGILAGLGIGLAGLTGGGVFLLLPAVGFLILLNGGLHVWYGWTAHHVVEKIDEAEGAER